MLDFLAESVIISIIGTGAGIICAVLIVKAGAIMLETNLTVTYNSVVRSVIISAILGTLFGIIPAYKASKYKPVEALRR